MDLVPHYDYTVSRHPVAYGVLDFSGSLAAFLRLPGSRSAGRFWLAFMGLLSGAPDWDVLIWRRCAATTRASGSRATGPRSPTASSWAASVG
jgi:hypothetical protein